MIKTLLTAVLALLAPATYAADVPDSAPETAAACYVRVKDSLDCLLKETRYQFAMCKLSVELSVLQRQSRPACVSMGLQDHYVAVMKQFSRNQSASNMTKDYYAHWRSAMRGLIPGTDELRSAYNARVTKLENELTQRGERLILEK